MGVNCTGWDPVHCPAPPTTPADVVNLGYVVNVVEDPAERRQVLSNAWDLTKKALLISARLTHEARGMKISPYGDGYMTRRRTFQKFYTQQELREWVDSTLDVACVPAAPGVVIAFRDQQSRQLFLSSTYRRALRIPSVRQSDVLYEEHKDLLDQLAAFVVDRGRIPAEGELPCAGAITQQVGSIRRAFGIVRRLFGDTEWETISNSRAEDLLVYLALDRFGGRPKFSDQPQAIQLDVKAFFGAYTRACTQADELLFSAGNMATVDEACRKAPTGKLTHDALYLHHDALSDMHAVIRVYEGCARNYVGLVEGANIVKLHRAKPKVSYLSYPDFDKDPHPALSGALVVDLLNLNVKYWDWTDSYNPPILHRKETFVPPDYPHQQKFARLTKQEERAGLYEKTASIGRAREWEILLKEKGLRLTGHRLLQQRET